MALNNKFRSSAIQKLSTQHGLHRYLLATLAGWLLPLSFAPYNYWLITPVAITLLLLAIRGGHQKRTLNGKASDDAHSFKSNAYVGWFFGLGFFGNGASWVYISIHDFGYTGIPLALILTTLFVMGLALLPALQIGLFQRMFYPVSPVWSFPALWVLFEWLRSWLLTGFPWLYVGNSLVDSPISAWLPVGGVYLGSFLLVMTGSLLFQLIQKKLKLRTFIAWFVFIFAGGHLLNSIQWTLPSTHGPIDVALVQGNVDQNEKWQSKHRQRFLQLYHNLSLDIQSSGLVIWPETAVPLLYRYSDSYFDSVMADLPKGTALITGIPQQANPDSDQQPQFYNSIMVKGAGEGLYQKQKLVPFGEYVPLESFLRGAISFFNLPMSNFIAGSEDQPLLIAKGLKIAPFICYEVVYPEFVRQQAKESDLMVTISNDSWFGHSVGPLQHLQMAQVRAAENGRYMLRGTNNGVTAIIDPKGRIQVSAPQFEEAIVRGEVHAMLGHTLFTKLGSTPILMLCALVLGIQLIQRRRQPKLQLF
ncbi:apolipoprotein N-acyltransferase [Oceanospirillum maris]|uniref:apolipoprotein N-acyltransferase n=1 Tax=Oceanospirillum maris TaxID=64977 RepID=UPI0004079E5D|nr:apolipoprotein N-acyltransferase [Oceanospirillum maris]